jgi:nitrate/TMAO reductase-like tetraheme cytochrome c subunit
MTRRLAYLAILSLSAAAVPTVLGYQLTRNFTPSLSPASAQMALMGFPEGTATPSEVCGACHQTIYKEFSEGFGSDLRWTNKMKNYASSEPKVAVLEPVAKGVSPSTTAHAAAGTDPWPIDAVRVEENGKDCNTCHYPVALEYPDKDAEDIATPRPRTANHAGGITCASCHLTPDSKIRGSYAVEAPHATVKDDRIKTSVACAFCHAEGERVVGKQTQTFLEWRDDFSKPGLGDQQCQDCHMPRTIRKLAENFDVPERVVGRHLWTGGHSLQRIKSALTLTVVQAEKIKQALEFHVTNVGAGHSVPSGSNRRGMYLIVEVIDSKGRVLVTKDWFFAPWYASRPDDRAFLEEDKKSEHSFAATQADEQGPHETIIRAGEERVLAWAPEVPAPGRYTVRARLVYDLNRYNDRAFQDDQFEMAQETLEFTIPTSQ